MPKRPETGYLLFPTSEVRQLHEDTLARARRVPGQDHPRRAPRGRDGAHGGVTYRQGRDAGSWIGLHDQDWLAHHRFAC